MKRSGWVVAMIALASAGAATARSFSGPPGAATARSWPQPAAGPSATGGPEILFTFDDGPDPRTTPRVLDALARHRIHAVFFMTGRRVGKRDPRVAEIIQRVLREGHVIGTHTMQHEDLCQVSEADAVRDLDSGKAAVERAAGVPTAWFRAPFGARCDRLERILADRRLAHFHWDLDPQEWKHHSAAQTVRYVTRKLGRTQARDVLLMHDVKRATARALPQILDWIAAENARRERSHQAPIRIVQAPDLAIERLPRGLGAWLGDATACARALPAAIASVLP